MDVELIDRIGEMFMEAHEEMGSPLPPHVSKLLSSAIAIMISIMPDMVRITCIVHEKMEMHNDVMDGLLHSNLIFKFLQEKKNKVLEDFDGVMHEWVLLVRDATERELGVQE